jgi:hypothetical protein
VPRIIAGEIQVPEIAGKFACGGCQRRATWRKELAGRRVRCKCGHVTTVPSTMPGNEFTDEVDMYDLADLAADAKRAAQNLEPTIVDPAAFAAAPAPAAALVSASGIPLAYQRPMTAREKEHAASDSHIDPRRDLQAPAALLLIGAAIYVGYYAIHYNLGAGGVIATSIGLTIMTAIETVILVGFALVVASPLGVSFGGFGTAMLKLAAIILICDGITTCFDGLLSRYMGPFGGSIFGFGAIGFPIALGIYWATLIYLFSMDPGDSWLVVVILAIFYRIMRIVLIVLLLKMILGFGGVGASAIAIPSIGGGSPVANPVIDEINEEKSRNQLREAKKYAADNGRRAEMPMIDAFYAAGAKNVWYEVFRDMDGSNMAGKIVVELPDKGYGRAQCYAAAKTYMDGNKLYYSPLSMRDKGDPYMLVGSQ